ncbi:MAG: hypothetical protein GPJ08_20680 [Microcystis aeruginosa G13-09]|nr:hypothetical protein [Microcystis aeruginosa G13-09]
MTIETNLYIEPQGLSLVKLGFNLNLSSGLVKILNVLLADKPYSFVELMAKSL